MAIKVNHVLSKNIHSKIFEAVFRYFDMYSDKSLVEHFFSVRPLVGMDIYHYHRPNLENEFEKNSFSTVHHDLLDTDDWLGLEKFIDSYRQMVEVICLNNTQQELLANYDIKHTSVIPWGYNEDVFATPKSASKILDVPNKLCIGLVSKRYGRKVKGEALLYEICKRIPADRFKFLLVGEGRSETGYYLEKLGFETEVFEYLPYRLFDSLYERMDILLITSLYEGGPANIPEAYAKGVPIVSTPVGFAKDYISHQKNGVLLTMNPSIDSDLIINLLNPEYYQMIQKNAESMRSQVITWRQVVEKYNDRYIKFAQAN